MIDLDAMELPRINYSVWPGTIEGWTRYNNFRNALPELIRLARIGQKVEEGK